MKKIFKVIVGCVIVILTLKACRLNYVCDVVAVSYTHLDVYKRQDIWCWNENLVKAENYEMAQQAKVATNIIADMITFYRNNLKADNNDNKRLPRSLNFVVGRLTSGFSG